VRRLAAPIPLPKRVAQVFGEHMTKRTSVALSACLLLAACGENEPAAPAPAAPVEAASTQGGVPGTSSSAPASALGLRETLVHPKGGPGETIGPVAPTTMDVGVRWLHKPESDSEDFEVDRRLDLGAPVTAAPAGASDGSGARGATRSTSPDGVERVSAALAGTTTPAPTFSFTTPTSFRNGGHPADANLAAGISHICVTGRDAVGCFTKAGVAVQIDPAGPDVVKGEQFFAGLTSGADGVFDMRSLYDIFRNRFVIVGLGASSQRTFVAVSKTLDPTKGWNKYSLQSTAAVACTPACTPKPGTNPPTVATGVDYAQVGVDGTAIYTSSIGYNGRDCDGSGAVEPANNEQCAYPWVNLRDAQQMADGVGGGSLRSWSFYDLKMPGGVAPWSLAPVVASTAPARGFLIGNDGASKLAVFGVANPLAANQSVTVVDANIQTFNSVGGLTGAQAPNPAGQGPTPPYPVKFDNLGNMPMSAQSRGAKILVTANDSWAVNGVTRAAARLVRIDTTNFATGSVAVDMDRRFGISSAGDGAGTVYDYGWPVAAQNAAGDVAVVTLRTAGSIWPQLRMSVWGNGEADLRSSILWRSSSASLMAGPADTQSWVDTGGVSIDPYDNSGIYFAQEYGSTFEYNNFQIAVAKEFGTTLPDIAPAAVTSTNTSAAVGQTITVTGKAQNLGDAAMPASKGQWYLSTDQVILSTDTKLGAAFDIGALSVGQTGGSFIVTAAVPSTLPPGTYYLGFCADTTNVAGEYAEFNNCNNVTSALAPLQIQITSASPAVRINCGDNGAQGSFLADQFFSGGAGKTRANAIDLTGVSNPAPLAVYQSQHYASPFTYTIPGFTAGSSHLIRLHFAETNPVNNAAGKRKFSVTINGGLQISNLDLFATVGMNKAYIKEFTLNANSSGQYVLSFTASVDSATISGIEVL
jgi:hypothetical protein